VKAAFLLSPLQHVKNTLASGEATFEHYKELSRRMIQNKIIPEKKIPETERDVVNFTTTYDNLRAETERKDKRQVFSLDFFYLVSLRI
jgi:hypothetical protein